LSKKEQLDIVNFQKKYFDDKGNISDPIGYHKALFAAMNPDKFAEHYYNLGKSNYAEEEDKISKNISMGTTARKPVSTLGNITVKVVK